MHLLWDGSNLDVINKKRRLNLTSLISTIVAIGVSLSNGLLDCLVKVLSKLLEQLNGRDFDVCCHEVFLGVYQLGSSCCVLKVSPDAV